MPHTVRVNGRRRAVEACQDVGQGIVTLQGGDPLLRGSGRHLPTRARARPSGGVAPTHLVSYANRHRCDKHVPFEPI
jgi:hypothetical protein